MTERVKADETNEAKKLIIKKEFEAIQKIYQEDPKSNSFNALVLGESGSGKSFMLHTCRGPVHVDSFDPGGSKGLKKHIEQGLVMVDSRFENEDPMKPTAFTLWEKEMERRLRMGYFDYIGTYVLDSSTTWADSIMNALLKRAGIPGAAPRFTKDYTPQKTTIRNWLKKILSFPCDVIVTGHLEAKEDKESGRMVYRYMTTGQGTTTIPLLFDEIYVMDPKDGSKGINYRLLTASTGTNLARSRLAQDGLLDKYEEPNIKKILKKAGYSTDDKPKLR